MPRDTRLGGMPADLPRDPKAEFKELLERLIKAQQENNDVLLGNQRGMVSEFNRLASDVSALFEHLGVETNAAGEVLYVGGAGVSAGEVEGLTAAVAASPTGRKPPGGPYDQEDGIGFFVPGPKGKPGEKARPAVPWPGQDGDDGVGVVGSRGLRGATGADGAPGSSGTGGGGVPYFPQEDYPDYGMWVPERKTGTTLTRSWFVAPQSIGVDDATQSSAASTPDLTPVILFSEATGRAGAYLNTAVPYDWAGGTVEVFIWWRTNTSTGNVRWLLSVGELAVGDAPSEVSDLLAATGTTAADSTTMLRTSLGSFTPAAAGSLLKMNLERNAAIGADTATGNAAVMLVEFQYTASGEAVGATGSTGLRGAAGKPGTFSNNDAADDYGMWVPPEAKPSRLSTVFGAYWEKMWKGATSSFWEDMWSDNLTMQGGLIPTGSTQVEDWPGTAAHPGVLQQTTLTSATGVSVISNVANTIANNPYLFGGGEMYGVFIFRIPVLSDATQTFRVRAGFIESFTGTVATVANNGCYFTYTDAVNSGKWQAISSADAGGAGAGATTTDTGITADTDWHKFQIIVDADGDNAYFYIDEVLVATNSVATDIPQVTGEEFCIGTGIKKSVGTTARTLETDAIGWAQHFTTQR